MHLCVNEPQGYGHCIIYFFLHVLTVKNTKPLQVPCNSHKKINLPYHILPEVVMF